MNRENLDFLYKMFPHHNVKSLDIIVVNQTTKDRLLVSEIESIKIINSFDKGLSKSRNFALQTSTTNWCLIADDDLVYLAGFEHHINKGIQKYETSGVIVFQAERHKNELLRNYPQKSTKQLSEFERFNVCSVEMLVHKKLINEILFNEIFGLGSAIFNSGEEQIFMHNVYKKLKLPISFYKKVIVQHPYLSTGKAYHKKGRYFTKGGIYAKLYPRLYIKWIVFQLFFDVKQGHLKLNEVFNSYKEALLGVQKLKNITNEKN